MIPRKYKLDRAAYIWQRIRLEPSGCVVWTGPGHSASGYGLAVRHLDGTTGRRPYRTVVAHRLVYEMWKGPIPDGLVLDHLCRNRRCCNPAHLEPVTHQENVNRGLQAKGVARPTRTKSVCVNGHEYTHENTARYGTNKIKYCRTCASIARRRYYLKNKDKIIKRTGLNRKKRKAVANVAQ